MTDDRERWALILGGVVRDGRGDGHRAREGRLRHLRDPPRLPRRDRRTSTRSRRRSQATGSEALYINMNAADDEKRAAALATLRERFDRSTRRRAATPTCGSSCIRSPSARWSRS